MSINLELICQLAVKAGEAIMKVYQQADFHVQLKADNSPVTQADLVAHQVIIEGLAALTPDIPVLSEEGVQDWSQRQQWQRYWLVDPLDGTKEFIKRNGEFTVNIALIEQGYARLGVIYAPAFSLMYCAAEGKAWKQIGEQLIPIETVKAVIPTIITSRSHPSPRLTQYLQTFTAYEPITLGSSLKFCLIAEGKAQCYPRFGPTGIWDSAAGQAIVEAAGGKVTDWRGQPLDYSPRCSVLNPEFIVSVGDIDQFLRPD